MISVKKGHLLLAVGLLLCGVGIALAAITRALGFLSLLIAGLLVIAVAADGLVPKLRCPVCGQLVQRPRCLPKDGTPDSCYRCSKCNAFVPFH